MVVDSVVSSAYKMKSNNLLEFTMSFMYIMKRRGPKIDPCGTPVIMGNVLEIVLSI